jgi:hypothetical protein
MNMLGPDYCNPSAVEKTDDVEKNKFALEGEDFS